MKHQHRILPRALGSGSAVLAIMVASSTAVGALSLVSVNQEIELGRQAQAEVQSQVPRVPDASVAAYAASLGRRIAAQAGGPRYPYSYTVANYSDINAFALPGGPVWIHRGAIQAAQNEAQLAGVMAHEIAHIANRHAASRLTKALVANTGLGILGSLLGNKGSRGQIAMIGGAVAANLAMAKFSRDDEREADEQGLIYMTRAGFDPRGMPEFMQVLRSRQGRDPGSVETFFASHPAPRERLTRLSQSASRLARGGRRDSAAFQSAKARLARLAPAGRSRR